MRNRTMVLIVTVALLLPAATSSLAADNTGPNIFLYDMGTENSPVWTGFTRVTPQATYSDRTHYGWVEPAKAMRTEVAEYMDALGVDCVLGVGNGTLHFRQDVPNGEYTAWILTGSNAPSSVAIGYLLRPHALTVQGREVVSIRPTPEEVFRPVKYDWTKGDDAYDQFVAPRFTWLRQDAVVTDGKLELGFANAADFPVCAVVIAEKAVADRVQKEIDRMDRQRREAFHGIWTEIKPTLRSYDSVSPEDRQRGYIVSAVNYLDDVMPGSAPPAGASRTEIEAFGTPGEQQQMSFAVYGLTDLRSVDFEVSDLKTAKGDVLPSSAVERGLVQFTARRLGHGPKFDLWPVLILPARPTAVGANTCKQFWMTVRVPENAAAGIYEGTIKVASVDASPTSLKMRFRVLPFKLPVPPKEQFLYFGTMLYHALALLPRYDEAKYWESVRAETRFLRDNEFCIAMVFIHPYQQRVTFKTEGDKKELADCNVSATDKLMQIVREEKAWPRDNTMVCFTPAEIVNYECGGRWRTGEDGGERGLTFAPTPQDRANFIRGVKIIADKGKKGNWPDLVFECGGELTNFRQNGIDFGKASYGALKEAGLTTALRGNGLSDLEVIKAGVVDCPQPNFAMMKKEWFDYLKAHNKRLWAYNYSTDRFGYGWFPFKHGITRCSFEAGIYFANQPGNIFDDHYGDFPLGLPTGLTTLAPTVLMKRIVEGCIDYKYLYMLDKLIKEADASGKPATKQAAAQAQAWLKERLSVLSDGVDDTFTDPRWYGNVQPGGNWTRADYDRYRWQAAEFIMALQKELGR